METRSPASLHCRDSSSRGSNCEGVCVRCAYACVICRGEECIKIATHRRQFSKENLFRDPLHHLGEGP